MNYNKLSADPTALILGIIALVLIILGFCCGFVVFVSLILGIVGVILSVRSLKDYATNPSLYSHNSRQNVYIGKILCLIAIILSALYFIAIVIVIFTYQVGFSDLFEKGLEEIRNQKTKDSIYLEEFKKESNDSIYIDSTFVDSIQKEN